LKSSLVKVLWTHDSSARAAGSDSDRIGQALESESTARSTFQLSELQVVDSEVKVTVSHGDRRTVLLGPGPGSLTGRAGGGRGRRGRRGTCLRLSANDRMIRRAAGAAAPGGPALAGAGEHGPSESVAAAAATVTGGFKPELNARGHLRPRPAPAPARPDGACLGGRGAGGRVGPAPGPPAAAAA
jgi:hypothetical protein